MNIYEDEDLNDDEGRMLKLMLPAGEIPLFSTVTKKTGEKLYELRGHITFFKVPPDSPIPQRVAGDGVLFMVDERGNIECITRDKEILWHVREDGLAQWLHLREMERESK